MNKILLLTLLWSSSGYSATYTGVIHFANRLDISFPVSGTLASVEAWPGKAITKGQHLLSLQSTPFDSAVIQAQSQLSISKTDLKEASRDLLHAIELYDIASLSTVELEVATLRESRTRARVDEAQARLNKAEYFRKHSRIESPFDGWVLDVNIKAGESVNISVANKVVLSVAQADIYSAQFSLSLTTIRALESNTNVQLSVDGKTYTGKITGTGLIPVNPSSLTTSKTKPLYLLSIKFKAGGKKLRSGEKASIDLPLIHRTH